MQQDSRDSLSEYFNIEFETFRSYLEIVTDRSSEYNSKERKSILNMIRRKQERFLDLKTAQPERHRFISDTVKDMITGAEKFLENKTDYLGEG